MACKCLVGVEIDPTSPVSLFAELKGYDWDAKLLLTLAAFALKYGEFLLLSQISSSNIRAKSMANLKKVGFITEASDSHHPLKHRFAQLRNFINTMFDLTRCVIELKEEEKKKKMKNYVQSFTIEAAVYWSIKSIVAFSIPITSFTMGHEYATESATKLEARLSILVHKIEDYHEEIRRQIEEIEMKKIEAIRFKLVRMFESNDIVKVLEALIDHENNRRPLFHGSTKDRVRLDILRKHHVLLLISGLNISDYDLSILTEVYKECQAETAKNLYEIVWMPILDQWAKPMEKHFEYLKSKMSWYFVDEPLLIDKAVISFLKEEWHFIYNKPMLVLLDPKGKKLNDNAIRMVWSWGIDAFPFTLERERELWKTGDWRFELLKCITDKKISNWIKDKDKYVFLYGGNDMELDWIEKFKNKVLQLKNSTETSIEIAYVGNSSKGKEVQRVIEAIKAKNLVHCWEDTTMLWTRLESMLISNLRAGNQGTNMQEIQRLVSYMKYERWAIVCKCSSVVVYGRAAAVLDMVSKEIHDKNLSEKDFVAVLKKISCSYLEFPTSAGIIKESMKCRQCSRDMEMYVKFGCCHDK